MTRVRVVASVALSLVVGAAFAFPATDASAAPKKKTAKRGGGAAPMASSAELNKLKGDFKWGMTPDEVTAKVLGRVEETYAERLKKTANDPSRQDKVRKEMYAEKEKAKKNYFEFKGQKGGWDVSIIDQEFLQGTGESMLYAKEETATRYFFFDGGRLYKMFIAFDKDMIGGKNFQEFGAAMQAKFGRAREVYTEEKTRAGAVKRTLDHYAWGSKSGDGLRLVDRSEFYGVYCLVLFDNAVESRLAGARESRRGAARSNALVEAATSAPANELDPNDDVVDRITGRQHKKPGEGTSANIVVPSPSAAPVRGPTPEEVNRADEPSTESAPAKRGKSKIKDGRPAEAQGLQL